MMCKMKISKICMNKHKINCKNTTIRTVPKINKQEKKDNVIVNTIIDVTNDILISGTAHYNTYGCDRKHIFLGQVSSIFLNDIYTNTMRNKSLKIIPLIIINIISSIISTNYVLDICLIIKHVTLYTLGYIYVTRIRYDILNKLEQKFENNEFYILIKIILRMINNILGSYQYIMIGKCIY